VVGADLVQRCDAAKRILVGELAIRMNNLIQVIALRSGKSGPPFSFQRLIHIFLEDGAANKKYILLERFADGLRMLSTSRKRKRRDGQNSVAYASGSGQWGHADFLTEIQHVPNGSAGNMDFPFSILVSCRFVLAVYAGGKYPQRLYTLVGTTGKPH
jgi:hypothetical protein